jgi:hypothetical protein
MARVALLELWQEFTTKRRKLDHIRVHQPVMLSVRELTRVD